MAHRSIYDLRGGMPEKPPRADEQRKSDYKRRIGRYNTPAGVGGKIEMPGRPSSFPPNHIVRDRTGLREEKDSRLESARYIKSLEKYRLPAFYPPPELATIGAVRSHSPLSGGNAHLRSDMECETRRHRRRSNLELV